MRNTLVSRLVTIFLLTGIVMSLSLIVVEMYRTYSVHTDRQESDREALEESILPSLTESLWNFDLDQVELICSGVLNMRSISSLKVFDASGEEVFTGRNINAKITGTEFYEECSEYTMEKERNGDNFYIGKLYVCQESFWDNERISRDFIYNFIYSLLQILIYLIILFIFINKEIAKPLVRFSQQIKEVKSGSDLAVSVFNLSGNTKMAKEIKEIQTSLVNAFQNLNKEIKIRQETEDFLKASLNDKEILLKEIHHRVKNNLQIVIGLLNIQQQSVSDPKVCEILNDSENRIYSMAMVHEFIYKSEELSKINLKDYLYNLGSYLVKQLHNNIEFNFKCKNEKNPEVISEPEVLIDEAIPCGLIINELITNSCKHAFSGEGPNIITLSMSEQGNYITITVSDNGEGFDFQPDNFQAGSVGLSIITNLCGQLKAEYGYIKQDRGTSFHFSFYTE